MESKLQVQVQIGDTRRVFLINPPWIYIDLITAILREIPKTKYMEFGLQYENDEGEYVVLNDDPVCLQIAISGSKRIEGTDVSRLKLRIFKGSSPSVKPKDDKNADQPGPSSISYDRSTARTCLDKDLIVTRKILTVITVIADIEISSAGNSCIISESEIDGE
jgi:hypothetical protein